MSILSILFCLFFISLCSLTEKDPPLDFVSRSVCFTVRQGGSPFKSNCKNIHTTNILKYHLKAGLYYCAGTAHM